MGHFLPCTNVYCYLVQGRRTGVVLAVGGIKIKECMGERVKARKRKKEEVKTF